MLSWERLDDVSVDIYMFVHPSLAKTSPSNLVMSHFLNMRKPPHEFQRITEWEIGRARNRAVEFFLKKDTKHTHLLMLDSDIVLFEDTLERLLLARKPVISAAYWEKKVGGELCAWKHSGRPDERAESIEKYATEGIVETELLGMGCCLIERWVLEELWNRLNGDLFRFTLSDTTLGDYWRVSEDFYFALQVYHQLGFRPLVDLDNKVGHEVQGYIIEKNKVVV